MIQSGAYGVGVSRHTRETESSQGHGCAEIPTTDGLKPASNREPWQAYAYMSRLARGGIVSIGSTQSRPVTTIHRVLIRPAATSLRPHLHAVQSAVSPAIQSSMISGP